MLNRIGLRFEIILNLCLVVGAALLFGGLLLLKMTEQQLIEQRISSLSATLKLLSRSMDLPGEGMPLTRLEDPLRELGRLPETRSWILVDANLQPVAFLAPSVHPTPDTASLQETRLASDPLVRIRYQSLFWPFVPADAPEVTISLGLFAGSQFIGAIQAGFSLEPIGLRMARGYRLVIIYVLLYGVTLVLFGSYLLGRNVVRPVRRMLTTTRQVTAGDLDQHLETSGPGEISELAEAFNTMLAALRESRSSLEARNRQLQDKNSELQETRDQLIRTEKMASVGHLAAGMAHEVGNPLGALVGYLELLKSELREGDERDLAERALGEAERIDRLVRDLLDFAAPGGNETGVLEPTAVIRETAELLSRQQQLNGVVVDLTGVPDSLPVIRIAAHKLQQVLINLLLNARDAVAANGRIEVSGEEQGEQVRIRIRDDGPGIPAELLGQVFNPFFTTKPPGRGRGLGLAVCHRVIEEAGGGIEVASGPEGGSCFQLRFPVASAEDGDVTTD